MASSAWSATRPKTSIIRCCPTDTHSGGTCCTGCNARAGAQLTQTTATDESRQASRANDRIDTGAGDGPRAFFCDKQLPVLAVEHCDRVVEGDLHLTRVETVAPSAYRPFLTSRRDVQELLRTPAMTGCSRKSVRAPPASLPGVPEEPSERQHSAPAAEIPGNKL